MSLILMSFFGLFVFFCFNKSNCSMPSSSKSLTGPYAYASYNRALYIVPIASTNVSYRPSEFTRPTHATVQLGMFVKYKELLLKQKQKQNKKHNYQAHLKGEFFPNCIQNSFLDVSENQGRIGRQVIYVCQFVHVSLSSTQFSSDQIQNGGVNSNG